jgi:putative ABC transport system permease protein
MSLLRIAWRSVQHRRLSSLLTGFSMALGVALVVTVLVILNTVDDTFRRNAEGFHLILGYKGGKLQLVLNTVYHLSRPVGNVPYDFYLEFAEKGEGIDADALFKRLDKNGDGVIVPSADKLNEVPLLVELICDRADRSPDGWVSEKGLLAAAARSTFAKSKLDAAALYKALDPQKAERIAVNTAVSPEVRRKFASFADPVELVDDFLEYADYDKPHGVLTSKEIARALRQEPYSLSGVTVEQVVQSLKPDGQGNYRLPDSLPDEIGEALVNGQFSFLLRRADREPDGAITREELAYAVKNPGRYAAGVDAIPICLGDSYTNNNRRFRVVGTTPDLFKIEYAEGRSYRFSSGDNFSPNFRDPAHFFEAVIGSVVASQTGLKVGDTFEPTHGISKEDEGSKHEAFTIVGILEPTGTPNDRALFVNIEGFYVLDNHAKDGQRRIHIDADGKIHVEPLPIEQREVTAILLRVRDRPGHNADMDAARLEGIINRGSDDRIQSGEEFDISKVGQAVYPTREVFELFDGLVGRLQQILLILAILIVVVAGVGIMVAIYNSMSERVRDIAVMRALGAGRFTVMMVVLLESSLLACLGGLCGFFLAHGLIGWVIGPFIIEPQTGVSLRFLQFVEYELALIPGLIVLSALAGFLPALAAYRTDVGKALSAAP